MKSTKPPKAKTATTAIGSNFLWEWAPSVKERGGVMLPAHQIGGIVRDELCSGFSSLYSFSPADAAIINGQDNSKGFARFAPASHRLVIDFDNGDKEIPRIVEVIRANGWRAKLYSSGGKGYHVYLYHQWIHDKALPYSQRCFVEALGLECDFSLYQAGRLLSLPGRIHRKTKKPKRLLKVFEGEAFELTIEEPPAVEHKFITLSDDPRERLAWALQNMAQLLAEEPKPGNRHLAFWKAGKDLKACGVDVESATGMLYAINNLWKEPKTYEEVRQAVEG